MSSVVLWDFDGTLAFRAGMWRGCMVETLDRHEPGHGIASEAFIPALESGFPWHSPETAHPELAPADWWAKVEALFARGYEAVGYAPVRAAELRRCAHLHYVDPTVGWQLFTDTVPVLTRLAEQGWRHVILSNHVPELSELVAGLGLDVLVDHVVCSAATGYEKPHPEAFAHALRVCGEPARVWMVGDNPEADVAGAERAGIPGILARTDGVDLYAVAEVITRASGS